MKKKKRISRQTKQNENSNIDSNKTTSKLCCFSALDYMILASTVAIALGEELSQTDISILSTFLAVLSDELALISSVDACTTGDNNVFVPPIPDATATTSENLKSPKTNHKKIVKRKIKKK